MNKDLFGDDIEEQEEELVEEQKKLTPFDFLNSITDNKRDLLEEDEENVSQYSAYVINRGLGYFPDTVLYANEMNMYPDIPVTSQYKYYLASLRKRQRRSKWFKLEQDDNVKIVQQVYNVRAGVAKDYLKILTEDNIADLKKLLETGETVKKGKKKK